MKFFKLNAMRKHFLALFLLAFMFVGTMSAQTKTESTALEYKRAELITLQSDFEQGTAKYTYVGDVISYVDQGLSSLQTEGKLPIGFYSNYVWNKADARVLREMTSEEMTSMQAEYQALLDAGNADVALLQKYELFLNANQ